MNGFTHAQIQHLAQYLLEDYSPDLTSQRLTDAILLVFEDIAGFELADEVAMNLIISQIREQYDELLSNLVFRVLIRRRSGPLVLPQFRY